MEIKRKVVAVSGGFDPIHPGHIDLLRNAKGLGGKLVVILNTDKFLRDKKGYVFMPYGQRKAVVGSIRYVDEVVKCVDKDHTVRKTLEKVRPDIFANGGDRGKSNVPETEVCNRLGIGLKFGVGGTKKTQSSSWLVEKVRDNESGKTFILTDSCMWEANKKKGERQEHAVEVVDSRTGKVRFIKSGSRIRFVGGNITQEHTQDEYNKLTS